MDTKAVLDHHLGALSAGDLEDLLSDYTDASVLLTADGAFAGRDALRGFYAAALTGWFKPGTYSFTMDVVLTAGDVAYIVWRASCAEVEIVLGTDTFIVRDGKIITQTFAAKTEPK
jgi:ketosteroid isomerase-like protein